MPRYNYECLDCLDAANKRHAKDIEEHGHLTLDKYEEEVVYETSHPMNPSEDELCEACECPRCGSHRAERTLHGSEVRWYTRGYGFLDKAGCHRDMNRFKLTQDDPYAQYRQEGEVDHIKDQLDKGGRHNPKTKYFTSDSKSVEKAVKKAVDTPTPKDE